MPFAAINYFFTQTLSTKVWHPNRPYTDAWNRCHRFIIFVPEAATGQLFSCFTVGESNYRCFIHIRHLLTHLDSNLAEIYGLKEMIRLCIFLNKDERVLGRQPAPGACPYCGGGVQAMDVEKRWTFCFLPLYFNTKRKYYCSRCSRRLVIQ
ncbi:hypothetical protein RJ639_010448 [Escallonia herrerae]|uniref:Zinc-ribbon 15 domain-containing protein n=1 Tax=Escallonia herrerae TaxID=1293975 RepID=A0AA89AR00_9ASTE|nr:hypothetical protein RJ639_010448 [Escallonia herrerae]